MMSGCFILNSYLAMRPNLKLRLELLNYFRELLLLGVLEHVPKQFLSDAGDVDRIIDFLIGTPLDQVFGFRFADAFDQANLIRFASVE